MRHRVVIAVVIATTLAIVNGCAWVTRVSVGTGGAEAQGPSDQMAVSYDGRYVAFASPSDDLVPDDTNGHKDIFLHDTVSGTTALVSLALDGGTADADSLTPSLSADGRFVAFSSSATNLVAGDTNGASDIFVRDVWSGRTTRSSITTSGVQANGPSVTASISADGSLVTFSSRATNLVPGDTNGVSDVFLHDRQLDVTTRVSVDSSGGQRTPPSHDGVIAGDGELVVFDSCAEAEVPRNLGGEACGTFAHDLTTGTTALIGGGELAEHERPAVSADGRFVAFSSIPASEDAIDVLVFDRATGVVEQASVDSDEAPLAGISWQPSISADGRYVAFWSEGAVRVRDRLAETTVVASADLAGRSADDTEWGAVLSGDGRYVAFTSGDGHLVAGDTNDQTDIFLRALPPAVVASVAPATLPRGTTTEVVITGTGFDDDAIVLLDGQGLTVTSTEVQSPFEIHAEITVAPSAPTGTRNLFVQHPGAGPGPGAMALGGCAACLTVG